MADTHELTLQVSGMDCASCARTVEQGVANLDGVDMCRVIFTSEQLQVRGDVDPATVVSRIRELGYDVVEEGDEAGSSGSDSNILTYMWNRRETRLALLAGLLILPGIFVTELGGMDHWLVNLTVGGGADPGRVPCGAQRLAEPAHQPQPQHQRAHDHRGGGRRTHRNLHGSGHDHGALCGGRGP